jgi:hypothetical protein
MKGNMPTRKTAPRDAFWSMFFYSLSTTKYNQQTMFRPVRHVSFKINPILFGAQTCPHDEAFALEI